MQVLVADDDFVMLEILRELVKGFGHECVAVADGEAAWNHLVAEGADIVISDWQMPGLNGLQLCKRVRMHPEIVYPYFILLTARDDYQDVIAAFRAGVDDHLAKPLDLDVLEAKLIVGERVRNVHLEILEARTELEAANARLEEVAHRDPLTGLGNRLRMNEELPAVHARFVREGYPYHVALFDIDHFKSYNDTHGHQDGDALLAEVGRVFASELRQGDLAYRFGGEEFLIVLPNRTIDEAAKGAERFRQCVADTTSASSELPAPATLSAGVAGAAAGESFEEVLARADKALYRAKNAGRDRVVIDTSESGGDPL